MWLADIYGDPAWGCNAMSPGKTTTATPRRDTAVCTAISRIRGICSVFDTNSQ
jgi:hypothetical protein